MDKAEKAAYDRKWYAENKERQKELRRARYQRKKDHENAVNRAWQEENREKVAEYSAAWYIENRERIAAKGATPEGRAKQAEKNRRYREKNPEKVRDNNRRRRALKLGAQHVPYTTQDVIDTYGMNCHWCGRLTDRTAPRHNSGLPGWEISLHIDHVIELVNGGSDTLENVRPACAKCNLNRPWKR